MVGIVWPDGLRWCVKVRDVLGEVWSKIGGNLTFWFFFQGWFVFLRNDYELQNNTANG